VLNLRFNLTQLLALLCIKPTRLVAGSVCGAEVPEGPEGVPTVFERAEELAGRLSKVQNRSSSQEVRIGSRSLGKCDKT
jgi:hypothetical protein